jgi:hypothetical protein
MLRRTTLGSTGLRRGYVPTRLARADARSAACVCSAAVTTTAWPGGVLRPLMDEDAALLAVCLDVPFGCLQ